MFGVVARKPERVVVPTCGKTSGRELCVAGFLSMKSLKMVSVSDDPDALIRALQVAELPDAAEKLGKLQQRAP